MITEEEYIVNLWIYICQIREYRKISQQNLADICDLLKSTIGQIERAEINTTIRTLVKIANTLELEAYNFLQLNC